MIKKLVILIIGITYFGVSMVFPNHIICLKTLYLKDALRPMSSAKSPTKQIKAAVSSGAKFSTATFRRARQKLDAYIENAMKEGRSQLYEYEIYEILKILGINVPEYTVIKDLNDIYRLPDAEKLVLKIISTSLHKSDEKTADGQISGVERDVSPEDAPQIIRRQFEIKGSKGVLVCPFIEKASGPSELLIGFTDAGPSRLICFGKGGFYTDNRPDKAYSDYQGYLPFSAKGLIASTDIGSDFIYGSYRSEKLPLEAKDLEDLIDMLVAFKRHYDDEGKYNISGLDINPLICQPDGRLFACDAKLEFKQKEPAKRVRRIERIKKLLHPKSIAVIGAAGTLPYRISANIGRLMDNLVDTFQGKLYFYLHKNYYAKKEASDTKPDKFSAGIGRFMDKLADTFIGKIYFYLRNSYYPEGKVYKKKKKAYAYRGVPFVGEVPDVDLCVIFRSKDEAIKVVEERLAKSNAAILIASGFEEVEEGKELAEKLQNVIDQAGDEGCMLGSNVIGLITPDFNATFADKSSGLTASKDSNIAFISQSGVRLTQGASSLALRNTKVHYGISIGNAVDLGAADCLEYILEHEQQIRVVAMYLEGTGGERLAYLINEARKKGVFVIIRKAGTTDTGAKATVSHTAADAGKFEHVKSVLEQAGAIVYSNTEDYNLWIDAIYTASYFAAKGIPQGNRVFGLASGGADAVTSADMEESSKLEFPEPDEGLSNFILKLKIANAVKNHLDLTAAISAEKTMGLLEYLSSSEQFDLILFEYLRWLSGPGKDEELLRFFKERKSTKPLVFASNDDSKAGREFKDRLRRSGFLVIDTTERAIRVLSDLSPLFKNPTAAAESLSVDGDNPTALDSPSAEPRASRFNSRKDTMVREAVSTAA